jgi:hypothetical protein
VTVTRLEWDIRFNNTVLPVVGGTLTIDDQNIPAIVGQVVVPHDDALYDAIDPRQTPVPRVSLRGEQKHWSSQPLSSVSAFAATQGGTIADLSAAWAGLTLGDVTDQFGAPLHGLASSDPPGRMNVSLHVREISSDGFTMTIDLASDEALLTDWAPTSGHDMNRMNESANGNPQQVRYWVDAVMLTVLGRAPLQNSYTTAALSAPFSDIIDWTSWSSAWDMMRPAIEDTNLKVRVHPDGETFTLERPENSINSPGIHSWLFTPDNTLSVRRVRSRSGDWYDGALMQASDGDGPGNGYPALGEPHSRTLIEMVPPTLKPTVAMAQNLVTRASNRGELIEITAPIQLKPTGGVFMRDEFSYVPAIGESGPEYQWITKSVHYDFLSATMRLRGERRY